MNISELIRALKILRPYGGAGRQVSCSIMVLMPENTVVSSEDMEILGDLGVYFQNDNGVTYAMIGGE